MGLGPPGRYQMALIVVTVGVDHGDFDAIHQADRVHADFSILESIVYPLHGRPVKNANGVPKGDCVPSDIHQVF
jgi:hypothetical protein